MAGSSSNMTTIASSPPSGGTQTHYGTPSTIPTIMSPEVGHNDAGLESAITQLSLGAPSLAGRRNQNGPSPIKVAKLDPKLKPTATEFTPLASARAAPDNTIAAVDQEQVDVRSPVSQLSEDSLPDTDSEPSTPGEKSLTFTSQDVPGVIGQQAQAQPVRAQGFPGSLMTPVFLGNFTINESPATRAFVVRVAPKPGIGRMLSAAYGRFRSLLSINSTQLNENGIFAVVFSDCAEAKQAAEYTQKYFFPSGFIDITWLLPKFVAGMAGILQDTVSDHEGEYIVSVINTAAPKAPITAQHIINECTSCGPVKSFHTIPTLRGTIVSYRVEWFDSVTDVTPLMGRPCRGFFLTVEPFKPDVVLNAPKPGDARGEDKFRTIMSLIQPTSPEEPKFATAVHNTVVIERIVMGVDVRTTIMLRNIPNRVDQAGLKKLLDETSHGCYDFMYLRIDFANNCNVGYAFINFVDPIAIINFAKARAGKKWNLFQSDKVAEISYATIQGRDCLIQKFRNSSVMLERTAFRPKLYKTGNGPDAGDEEEFPEADNQAKLKRSCDNAEHVGLYIPQAGPKPLPITGPLPLRAPRNQRPGGRYTQPAHERRAIALNKALDAYMQDDVAQSDGVDYEFIAQPPSPSSLYAPREGQAYRERQRRQFSQFDRGTPGAETEFAAFAGHSASTPSRSISTRSLGGVALQDIYGHSSLATFGSGLAPRQSMTNTNYHVPSPYHQSFNQFY